MNWTRHPSKAAAGRAVGLAGATIGALVNGRKLHHAGVEARRCDSTDDDNVDAEDADEARAPPSPPFFSAMVTKPVVLEGMKSGGGGSGNRSPSNVPQWLESNIRTTAGSQSQAVEVRSSHVK